MPAQRRDPKEEGSLAILAGNPVLWLPYLLLAAAALMLLLPAPQMATEARASSNNRLPALKRRGAPSFVNGYTSSDIAIGLQACNPRLRAKPRGSNWISRKPCRTRTSAHVKGCAMYDICQGGCLFINPETSRDSTAGRRSRRGNCVWIIIALSIPAEGG